MSPRLDGERPIYINMLEFSRRSRTVGLEVTGLVPSLLAYGNNQAFMWDPIAVSRFLAREHPAEPISPKTLIDMETSLVLFFVTLPDGRWAPDPAVFSAVDGNPGMES